MQYDVLQQLTCTTEAIKLRCQTTLEIEEASARSRLSQSHQTTDTPLR